MDDGNGVEYATAEELSADELWTRYVLMRVQFDVAREAMQAAEARLNVAFIAEARLNVAFTAYLESVAAE